ncbi:protein PRRC1 isoform X2 [Plutella xylostella]|uniref:protein PRRC1 isoform X2 n=1 Tax=Plutella xylostella TaxID=51655 RepID=UPI002032D2C1|nr:protein PRRC1 isoform X2 [Plutella xylostella]
MSNPERKKIPEAPTPAAVPGSGNLLSSIAPPAELPNFVTTPIPQSQLPPAAAPAPVQPMLVQPGPASVPDAVETFTPAIPLSKGMPVQSVRSPDDSQATAQSPESLTDSPTEAEKLGDVMPGSGLLTWVKGAVSSGGLLQRVAERARSSVDSVITTLDPQMKDYLNSGGDLYLVVASDKEVKVSPVRDAFQAVFGKATVHGFPAQSDVTAAQPVGYAAAYAAAKQRIAHIRSTHSSLTNNVPIVAVEGFLQEAVNDRWYDISLIVLSQPSLDIELQVQSQGTPVPAAAVAAARAGSAAGSAHGDTGFDITIGSIMADSLKVPHTEWQEACTGVSRRELLLLAARSIAGSYRRLLAISAAEP